MAKSKKPTIRAVWLGQALKEVRETARLTVRQVGDHIGKDGSTVSRIECGEQPVSSEVLDGYLNFCGVDDPRRRGDLATIRTDVAQGGWWDGYRRDVASTLMDRAWMESKAVVINSFEALVMPGLLQLPEYAEALMRRKHPEVSDQEIGRWVDMRMQRQHVLSRHRPVKFSCVIDEPVLRRSCGSPGVMKEQLDFLMEAGERPNITIRVLPLAGTGVEGSFEIIQLASPYPEIAYVATPSGDLCIEGAGLDRLRRGYTDLQEASLDPAASHNLILAERDRL